MFSKLLRRTSNWAFTVLALLYWPLAHADLNSTLNQINEAAQNANEIMNNTRQMTNPNNNNPNNTNQGYSPPPGSYPPQSQGYGSRQGYGYQPQPQGYNPPPQDYRDIDADLPQYRVRRGYRVSKEQNQYNIPQIYSAPQAMCRDSQGVWYFEYTPDNWVRSQVQYLPGKYPENVAYPTSGPCASYSLSSHGKRRNRR